MAKKRKGWKYLGRQAKLSIWWEWHRLTAIWRVLPDFLIIGVMKGGTTSLFNYLIRHPLVFPPFRKEIKYFDCNYPKGYSWYRAHFPLRIKMKQPGAITGEATPYYIFHPLAPRRIAQTLPGAKLIVLLRNPVDRAYSHYQHMVRVKQEKLPFQEALAKEEKRLEGEVKKIISDPCYPTNIHIQYSYLARGRYLEQLKKWDDLFPPHQFLILQSEDFYTSTALIYQETLKFLGLPLREPKTYHIHKEGDYEPMNPKTRKWLVDYFEPYNEQLYAHLDRNFDWDK